MWRRGSTEAQRQHNWQLSKHISVGVFCVCLKKHEKHDGNKSIMQLSFGNYLNTFVLELFVSVFETNEKHDSNNNIMQLSYHILR